MIKLVLFWDHKDGSTFMNQSICYCQGARITGTTSAAPPVLPPLHVPVHPPLDAEMCRALVILVCWAEEASLNYGCFTGFRLKGRQRECLKPP